MRTQGEDWRVVRAEATVELPSWADEVFDGGMDAGLTEDGLRLLREVSVDGAYWPAPSLLGHRPMLVIKLQGDDTLEAALERLDTLLAEYGRKR